MFKTLAKFNLFIITLCIAYLFFSCISPKQEIAHNKSFKQDDSHKFWIWLGPQVGESDSLLAERYKKYYDAGVKGILFGSDNEQHFRIAKEQGLETHRWIWIMNRGESYIRENHPGWYAVNRKGESCFDQPPYVDYYRWLCPSRPEVIEYLKKDVDEVLNKNYVDGIHLDYIRFSDVILASNLWQIYGIEQQQEYPQYDYCYCEVCKNKFKEEYGINVDSIAYPSENLSWKKFRYDAVTNVVNELTQVAKEHNKPITAAVFPTPDVAKRLVRQDWTNWELNAVFPMIYHGFYQEQTPWIATAVKEGLRGLNERFPLYAGLYIPDFKDNDDLRKGINYALGAGATGIALFGTIDDEKIELIKEFKNK